MTRWSLYTFEKWSKQKLETQMRNLIAVLILGTVGPLYGQVEFTTSATNDGRTVISYKNSSTAGLTAFVAGWLVGQPDSSHSAPSLTCRDVFIEDNLQTISPGASHSLYVGGKGLTVSQAQILAAVFEDGSSFGDPAWVRLIQMRRGYYLGALDAGLSDLKAAAGIGVSREVFIQQLTSSQEAQIEATKTAPAEDASIMKLFNEPTVSVKDANLQVVAKDNWRSCIRAVYVPLIRTVSKSNEGTTSATIATLTNKLTSKRIRLLEAKLAPRL